MKDLSVSADYTRYHGISQSDSLMTELTEYSCV
jgi:hypothetical protein